MIRCTAGKIKLLRSESREPSLSVRRGGKVQCNDPLLNDIWQLGVNTIQTCSEDAYVDCATRERTEWLADAVMVAYPISRLTMAGPAIDGKPYWSDPRLFGNLLRHIGQSVQPDGRVKARHPSDSCDIHGFIEDYACLWIQGLRTWHRNTGDLELVREMWPAVTAQLRWFLDRRTERGLVKAREFVYFGNPLIYKECEGATLNAFLAKALADAAELAGQLGDADRQHEYVAASQSIKKAINLHLWEKTTGTYHGAVIDGKNTPCTVHAAASCLYYDIVPAGKRKQVEKWFLSQVDKEACFPYQYAFYFEVLARMNADEADLRALNLIRKQWTTMASFETKTTFESFGPGENCHESGGAPTIYLSRHVLGVEVDGPAANRRVVIQPHLGDLKRAEGIVVTEWGLVPIRWNRAATHGRLTFNVEIPAGVEARLLLPHASHAAVLTVDGRQTRPPEDSSGGFVTVNLRGGKHRGDY